jgi:hypothetical protein
MFAITIADFKNIHAKYGPNRPVVQQEIGCNSLKNSETNGRKIFIGIRIYSIKHPVHLDAHCFEQNCWTFACGLRDHSEYWPQLRSV